MNPKYYFQPLQLFSLKTSSSELVSLQLRSIVIHFETEILKYRPNKVKRLIKKKGKVRREFSVGNADFSANDTREQPNVLP